MNTKVGKLDRKTALITGGSSGIGRATARRFMNEGCRVAVTGRSDQHMLSARQEFGDTASVYETDASSVDETRQLADQLKKEFGSLDILFLNAGIILPGDLETATEEQFDELFNLHVKGPFFAAQVFAPLMPEGSSIMITTSNSSRIGMDSMHIYQASKAAAAQLVRSLAGELVDQGIRVNAISPGPIATNVGESARATPEQIQALTDYTLAKVPMGRFADPDEVAAVALFLASSDASFITGAEIDVDGGWAPGVCR